jgi:anaerobic selenocysteine-containing dehydrogenase
MHLLKQLAEATGSKVSVTWKSSEKLQPEGVKFKIPSVDAPNATGARDLGLIGKPDPDVSELAHAVERGEVKALYVFDPGPAGSIGDIAWIIAARESGRLPLLIVQGVLHTELTAAADFVLAGASSFEKDASYTNDQGKVQGAALVIAPPGDGLDDCTIFAKIGVLLDISISTPERARAEIAALLAHLQAYGALQMMSFARPVAARTWLQASNPSERWKWDFLFQDLPPIKGTVDLNSLPPEPGRAIPLKVVK